MAKSSKNQESEMDEDPKEAKNKVVGPIIKYYQCDLLGETAMLRNPLSPEELGDIIKVRPKKIVLPTDPRHP